VPTWWDKQTWEFVNTFAPWLSAIGTIAAVGFSLWLARARSRVRLKMSVDARFIVEPTSEGYKKSDDYIAFWITNIGETEATVTVIGWLGRAGFKRQYAQQNLGEGPYAGPSLPHKLKFGEELRLLIKLEEHWLDSMSDGMLGRIPWLTGRLLRAVVWTSIGQSFKVRPDHSLISRLLEHAKKRRRA